MAIDTIKSTAVLDGSITSDDLSYPLTGFSSTGIDDNATSTAITISSDEEVLLGKTTNAQQTAGTTLYQSGQIYATAAGSHPLVLTRKTNDGALSLFYKDTNEVGRIDANGGSIIVGSGNTGLYFDDGSDRLIPVDPASSSGRDNAVNLGGGSERFKDLYLSGGIYLGGTGSANKLDDYEEGTFTPSLITGTVNGKFGHYTKIGNIVIARIEMGDFSNTSANSNIEVNNLPFTSSSSSSTGSTGSVFCRYCTRIPNATYVGNSDTRMVMWQSSSGSYVTVKHADLNSGSAYFYIQVIYEAA